MVNAKEKRPQVNERRRELRLDQTEDRRQLVERSVRFDAGGILRYARGADKSGRSIVARTGIEPRSALASGRPRS